MRLAEDSGTGTVRASQDFLNRVSQVKLGILKLGGSRQDRNF